MAVLFKLLIQTNQCFCYRFFSLLLSSEPLHLVDFFLIQKYFIKFEIKKKLTRTIKWQMRLVLLYLFFNKLWSAVTIIKIKHIEFFSFKGGKVIIEIIFCLYWIKLNKHDWNSFFKGKEFFMNVIIVNCSLLVYCFLGCDYEEFYFMSRKYFLASGKKIKWFDHLK